MTAETTRMSTTREGETRVEQLIRFVRVEHVPELFNDLTVCASCRDYWPCRMAEITEALAAAVKEAARYREIADAAFEFCDDARFVQRNWLELPAYQRLLELVKAEYWRGGSNGA